MIIISSWSSPLLYKFQNSCITNFILACKTETETNTQCTAIIIVSFSSEQRKDSEQCKEYDTSDMHHKAKQMN